MKEQKISENEIISKLKKLPKSVWVYLFFVILFIFMPTEESSNLDGILGLTFFFGCYWIYKFNLKKKKEKEIKKIEEEQGKLTEEKKEYYTSSVRKVDLSKMINQETIGIKKLHCVMHQRNDGTIYFDNNFSQKFVLLDYEWSGAEYTEVIVSNSKGKNKEKVKRTGRFTGALIGTLVCPGVGTLVGGMLGTGNEKIKGKHDNNLVTTSNKVENNSIAALKLMDKETGFTTTIGFDCNSKLNIQISSFIFENIDEKENDIEYKEELSEKERLEILKNYKELLDSGIIDQYDFDKKKKELLKL